MANKLESNTCPLSKTINICQNLILFFNGKLNIIISNRKEGREPFTFQYGIKYLNLKNSRKENIAEYNKLNKTELLKYCDEGGSISKYCKENHLDFNIISRGIESELSVKIWEKMMEEIPKIDISDFVYESDKDALIYANKEIVDITLQAMKQINNDTGSESNTLLQLGTFITKDLGEDSIISNKLYEILFIKGITKTIMSIYSYIKVLKSKSGEMNKEIMRDFFKENSTFFFTQALTNTPYSFISSFNQDKEQEIYINKTTIEFLITKDTFKKMVHNGIIEKEKWTGEYSGCPLLFEKHEINGKEENGIIAYQIVLAEFLCKLLNSGE